MRSAALFSAALIFSALFVAGCSNPSAFPKGYNNGAYYKSAPGPEAAGLNYDYTPEMNDTILTEYERVAADLVYDLEVQSGGLPQDMKFIQGRHYKVINQTMDYALRQELIVKGYSLYNDHPLILPELVFSVARQDNKSEEPIPQGRDLFLVSVTLTDGGKDPIVLLQTSGLFVLPDYIDYWKERL